MPDLRVRDDVDWEVARHRLQHCGCQRCGTPSAQAKFLIDGAPAMVVCIHCANLDELDRVLAWIADEELSGGVEFSLTLARLDRHGIVVDAINGYRMDTPPGV